MESTPLLKVYSAFSHYKNYALAQNHRRRRDFHSLSQAHQALISSHLEKINKVDTCIDHNMMFIQDIMTNMFLEEPMMDAQAYPAEMDKVKSTLKQFVRDWSKEGEVERKITYDPIMNELDTIYKNTENRSDVRVLVPGAGLGRLAFDIAKSGFSCQGNEFSYYMLFASHFVLNRMTKSDQYLIYPFIHSFSNIKTDALLPITIPDVLPSSLAPNVDFSMVAGDFIDVYAAQPEAWDVVVTCFFMDTAKNILEYIEVIHRTLVKGGTWINMGPLLYHFEDNAGSEPSIELSLEQLKQTVSLMGFEIKHQKMISTTYTRNPDGMLNYVYDCAFWSAVKL
ncbi:N2227-like protein-domain-containing protein [Mucor mucedo]|uniref:N2227-like protein-domain-containing protein n=1 Tax=Mucor mucedo TaxID=29922 RepID=UPI00221FC292|nr:N2227-like protein-domain-containing protein [Mucor mucedo]KAI7890269.1 N2227-like protein-domain-containing protein [Mucor mucedo]